MHVQSTGQQSSIASSVCCRHKDVAVWRGRTVLEGGNHLLPRPQSIVPVGALFLVNAGWTRLASVLLPSDSFLECVMC